MLVDLGALEKLPKPQIWVKVAKKHDWKLQFNDVHQKDEKSWQRPIKVYKNITSIRSESNFLN